MDKRKIPKTPEAQFVVIKQIELLRVLRISEGLYII